MFEKGNTLGKGRPPNSESIRVHLRSLGVMTYDELQKYRPKSTFEIGVKRRLLEFADETKEFDYRAFDSLMEQLDGKPKQTVEQTITAPIEIIIDESEKDV